MGFLLNKYYATKGATVFKRTNGVAVASLSMKLFRDDWNMIVAMVEGAYSAGVTAGSEQRAAEIREALGISDENHIKLEER